MDAQQYQIGFLFAGFCVAVYAHQRFNSPNPLRCTTTLVQYYMALTGYMVSALVLYAILSWGIQTNPDLRTLFSAVSNGATEQYAELPAPFIAALFLTILLPRIPVLKTFDSGVQSFFRKLGAIPHKALRLSWKLQRKPFAVPASTRSETIHRLEEGELDPEAFLNAPDGTPEALWVKIISLKVSIEDYVATNPGFRLAQEGAFAKIEEDFLRHSEMATILYTTREPPARLRRAFTCDCKALLKDMSEVVARGMLRTHRNMRTILADLTTWGFDDLENDLEQMSLNQVAGLILGLGTYLLVLFLVVRGGDASVSSQLKWAITIAIIMGTAAACAVLPKSLLPEFTRRDRHGHRPVLFYVLASAAAAGFWFGIHFLRYLLEGEHSAAAIPAEILEKRYWVIMPVTVAFATAWLADNRPGGAGIPKDYQSWFEGATLALLLAAASFLVQLWRLDGAPIDMERIVTPLSAALGMGFIIGYFVPTLYRKIPEDEEQLRREAEEMHRFHRNEAAAAG